MQILSLNYMKTHSPWPIQDLPYPYFPVKGYAYYPPNFVIGTPVTRDQFLHLAKRLDIFTPKSYSADGQFIDTLWPFRLSHLLAQKCQLSKYYGVYASTVPLKPVFKMGYGDEPLTVLSVASNYRIARMDLVIPFKPCELLTEVLEDAGVKTEWQWFLQWDEVMVGEDMDWSQDYLGPHSVREAKA